MYTLGVQRSFTATHHLIGGDWGAENDPHSHAYRLEVQLEGEELDQHGYLTDIVAVERELDQLVGKYRGADLNADPDFAGLNPSLEHFARIVCAALAARLAGGGVGAVSVQLWESEIAWVRYRLEL